GDRSGARSGALSRLRRRARRPSARGLAARRVTVEVHFRLDGPEDAPALVLSNSLGTTHRMWDAPAAALSTHRRVLRYDTRGHGESPVPPGPYSVELLGRD